jgi:phosphoglycerate dehydrogenase-like enzyme
MRPDAVLVNISRGDLVDEDALVDALREGRLRGAGLDVFGVEPVPRDHSYWGLPNVIVTPHVSAVTRSYWRREVELIVENLRRFLGDEPLTNVVDKIEAY